MRDLTLDSRLDEAGLPVLVERDRSGVHPAVSEDGFRIGRGFWRGPEAMPVGRPDGEHLAGQSELQLLVEP
jgi:hypothetical protein